MRTDLDIIIVFFIITIVTILAIQTSNAYAVDFVDHTGYTPYWAQSMGTYQTLDKCNGIAGENSADGNWCMEWVTSVIDQGSNSFNPQTTSPVNQPISPIQNLPMIVSKSSLIEFLPTRENIGQDYKITPAMGVNESGLDAQIKQKMDEQGFVDSVSQGFMKTNSENSSAIFTTILKFNSNDNASAFYNKIIISLKGNTIPLQEL